MPPKRVRRPAQLAPQASHELFPIIDHVVILVPDLEAAIQSYSTQLGFRVIPGGKHAGMPGQRTWNALIPFEADGTYIELIAFMPKHVEDEENRKEGKELAPAPGANKPEKDHRWWGLAPGLIDYALLPKDIDSAISTLAKLPGNPIQYAGPAPGARKTPSGRMLEWKMGYPPSLCPARNDADADRPLPFFCYDVTPREWRVPLEESEDKGGHTNGVVGLGGVTILAGISESAAVSDEVKKRYKGPSFDDVIKAYAGWCLPAGQNWQSVVEHEECFLADEMEPVASPDGVTPAPNQPHELVPQPDNTVILTKRIATFKLQNAPPSVFHATPQLITIAEAATAGEVAHLLANGSSMYEMELIADAGRMWGLENGSAGDEGELMPIQDACGARIRVRYVWGIDNGARL